MPITSLPISGELSTIRDIQPRAPEVAAPGFSDHFKAFVADVNSQLHEAEAISKDFADGKINNIHETMIATERASIAFKLVGSVRTKALEAYHEIMRMPM